jgi:hypothetical protein
MGTIAGVKSFSLVFLPTVEAISLVSCVAMHICPFTSVNVSLCLNVPKCDIISPTCCPKRIRQLWQHLRATNWQQIYVKKEQFGNKYEFIFVYKYKINSHLTDKRKIITFRYRNG